MTTQPHKPKRVKRTPKDSDYIDNVRLHEAFVQWAAYDKQPEEANKSMPSYIAESIMLLPERYCKSHNWIRYTDLWKDEFKTEAIAALTYGACRYNYRKFNNPLAFLTTVMHNGFLRALNALKREQQTKADLTARWLIENEHDTQYINDMLEIANPL